MTSRCILTNAPGVFQSDYICGIVELVPLFGVVEVVPVEVPCGLVVVAPGVAVPGVGVAVVEFGVAVPVEPVVPVVPIVSVVLVAPVVVLVVPVVPVVVLGLTEVELPVGLVVVALGEAVPVPMAVPVLLVVPGTDEFGEVVVLVPFWSTLPVVPVVALGLVVVGVVVVDCPTVLPEVVPAVEPAVAPVCVPVVGLLVVVGLVLVVGPVLVLLPLMLPVEPAVCAAATPKASRKAGAIIHVFIV